MKMHCDFQQAFARLAQHRGGFIAASRLGRLPASNRTRLKDVGKLSVSSIRRSKSMVEHLPQEVAPPAFEKPSHRGVPWLLISSPEYARVSPAL